MIPKVGRMMRIPVSDYLMVELEHLELVNMMTEHQQYVRVRLA